LRRKRKRRKQKRKKSTQKLKRKRTLLPPSPQVRHSPHLPCGHHLTSLLPASGIEHIDTMTSHLRGVVHENIPSEFHDLFYLFVALVGLFVMYIGVRRVARMLGLSANQGKSE
jgi:hypothetical protein